MAVSFWGVEHGEPVSKASPSNRDKAKSHIMASTILGASPVLPATFAAGYGALTGKKGRKTGAAATTGGGTLAGKVGGGMLGGVLTRGAGGALVGRSAGGALGSYLGSVNNVQHGRVAGIRPMKYPMSRGKR